MTTAMIIQLITTMALIEGVNPETALTIAKLESSFKVNAIGPKQEVGLFQIHNSSTKYTKKQLLDPHINIKEGLRILKEVKSKCKHQEDKTFVICYNTGIYGASKIKYPKLFPYYKRFLQVREKIRSDKNLYTLR